MPDDRYEPPTERTLTLQKGVLLVELKKGNDHVQVYRDTRAPPLQTLALVVSLTGTTTGTKNGKL